MRLQTKIPPPVYMLLFGFMMFGVSYFVPLVKFDSDILRVIGIGLIGLAILFDLWSITLFFMHKTTVNPLTPHTTVQFVKKGLYRYTRNPMYVGLLVMLTGWTFYLGSLSPLFLLPLFVWIITWSQIIPEEKILRKKFGVDYEDYMKKTPQWLW